MQQQQQQQQQQRAVTLCAMTWEKHPWRPWRYVSSSSSNDGSNMATPEVVAAV
jgi:hypothetical protein